MLNSPDEDDDESTGLSENATIMNLLTMLIGAGVLAYPSCVKACGWILAPIFVIVICATNFFINTILLDVIERAEEKGEKKVTELKDIEYVCFGTRVFTDWMCIIWLFFLAAAFLVLLAENLMFIYVWPLKKYMICAAAVTGGMAFIKDIDVIARLSIIGVIASIMYVICIVVGSTTAFMTYEPAHRQYSWMPPEPVVLPMTACVMLFGFNCQYAVPAVRSSMKNPGNCRYCIGVAHVLVGGVYLVAGVVGYWGWGERIAGNVLKSMCAAPGCEDPADVIDGLLAYENWKGGAKMFMGKILACAVVANLIVTIPLNTDILFKVWEGKLEVIKHNYVVGMVARECTVVLLLAVAVSIPFFKEFLNIISSFLGTLLGILVPVGLALRMDRIDRRGVKAYNVVLFLIGIGCLIMGTMSAVKGLAAVMRANAMLDDEEDLNQKAKEVAQAF
jgi:amino acid permease